MAVVGVIVTSDDCPLSSVEFCDVTALTVVLT